MAVEPTPLQRIGPDSLEKTDRRLSEIPPINPEEAVNIDRPRRFFLTMRHMQWTINGRTFRMEEVADDEVVRIGTKELWEFDNTGGGMGMMRNYYIRA